jgi:hypothetical protein
MNGIPGDSTTYTKPQHAIALDYMGGKFTVHRFDTAMVSSTIAPGSNGTSQTLIADENGRLWVFGIGTTDGAHTSNPITVRAKGVGSAMSVRLSNASGLYTGGSGLAGAMAYWVEGNKLGRITTNSASGFRMASPGFVTAPSAGDTIHIGRIPAKWKSKAFVLRDPGDVITEPAQLVLFYEPKVRGSVRVRFYLNRSASAFGDYQISSLNAGVSQDPDTDYYLVDITDAQGAAQIPLPNAGDSIHTIEFEVEVVSATPFEMTGFTLDGWTEEED